MFLGLWAYVIDDEEDMFSFTLSLSISPYFLSILKSHARSHFHCLLSFLGSLCLICIAICVRTSYNWKLCTNKFCACVSLCAWSEENSCQIEREIKTARKRTVKFFHTVIIYALIMLYHSPIPFIFIWWTALENTLLSNAMALLLRNK